MTRLHRALRRRGEETGASAIELVVYAPILMVVTFLVVQFALCWYGSEVAGATARESARVARVGQGTDEAIAQAKARGLTYAKQVGGQGLDEVQVTVRRVGNDKVRATVTGRAIEIVPGFAPRISQSVEGPVEQFRPDL
ncbi:TadE/TadG family type IV pilus assembly protein [Cellulomonas sp. HZM]|uniref:TadE/TadG family type IV pilus assembly protein n=1 Tax=Cellulomonas sp. HZM TaxID=1454010 RepID=UPI000690B793|nr:TadE/TadG family type IV pilus assembly protein [Cellulomonas sp. HZM]